ncbi:hypothetical protein ACI2OX_16125 [Bacillus sp. N9]
MLASMFIGFGVIVAFKTGNFFYLEQSPLAYPMAAITFERPLSSYRMVEAICLQETPFITRLLH